MLVPAIGVNWLVRFAVGGAGSFGMGSELFHPHPALSLKGEGK